MSHVCELVRLLLCSCAEDVNRCRARLVWVFFFVVQCDFPALSMQTHAPMDFETRGVALHTAHVVLHGTVIRHSAACFMHQKLALFLTPAHINAWVSYEKLTLIVRMGAVVFKQTGSFATKAIVQFSGNATVTKSHDSANRTYLRVGAWIKAGIGPLAVGGSFFIQTSFLLNESSNLNTQSTCVSKNRQPSKCNCVAKPVRQRVSPCGAP